jgi:hypothetical protein
LFHAAVFFCAGFFKIIRAVPDFFAMIYPGGLDLVADVRLDDEGRFNVELPFPFFLIPTKAMASNTIATIIHNKRCTKARLSNKLKRVFHDRNNCHTQ